MGVLEQVERGVYVPRDDDLSIADAVAEAIKIAAANDIEVELHYYVRKIYVRGDSDAALLVRDYERYRWGFLKRVGPYPKPVSAERLAAEEAVKGRPDLALEAGIIYEVDE